MNINEYYQLTPVEFSKFIIGFENRKKHEYNLARFISYFSIKPHLDKAQQNKDIDSLIPFNWETKKKKYRQLTVDEVEELRRKFNF